MSLARQVAFRVVRRVLEQGAYADRALEGEGRRLDTRDRAFAQQLVFGTVQRQSTLDHIVDAYVEREPPDVARAALHLGIYQLLFLDGVADHAAVGETVELLKGHRAAGMVNAVLRKVARDGFELPADDTPAGAALHHAHPRWLVDLWWDWLGPDETRALLAADNRPAERGTRESPNGDVVFQSSASQLVSVLVDPQPGERVLDLCAAPGGKTTHLAALMENRGEVVAYERHGGRATALEARCRQHGADIVKVVNDDAVNATGTFDRVLLDPPCSGLGTLSRNPDLRWRMTPQRIAALVPEQDRLLEVARARVAPGGRLVYSVCTLNPAEDRLETEDLRRTWPHRDATDGFSIAIAAV
ncbi:MAG: rRNA (cytosine967-C5)-methyltransferase [Solirubrobacteraceae bacterium]|nr:rRNA (cytosine967-C5)-methyltransferase [Solirubrobacteraceae bacterium]